MHLNLSAHSRIILAWDKSSFEKEDERLLARILPHIGMVKVGLQAMMSGDPFKGTVALAVQEFVYGRGGKIMLDGKFKDIKNTVIEALRAVIEFYNGWCPSIVTVHASLRRKTLEEALSLTRNRTLLTGVTVLTDYDDDDSTESYGRPVEQTVVSFASKLSATASSANVPMGIVCSPRELVALREQKMLVRITPGVRPKGADNNDQARVMTPGDAVAEGAEYVVIGRPILGAKDPYDAVQYIVDDIAGSVAAGYY